MLAEDAGAAPRAGAGDWRAVLGGAERSAPASVARVVPVADAPSDGAVAVAAPPAPPPAPAAGVPTLNVVVERWEEVVERVRGAGKGALAAVLAHAAPVAISGKGILAVQLEEASEIWERALEAGREDVVLVLRELFGGIERVTVRRAEGAVPAAPPKRMTAESIREERIAAMRKKDPLLSAAIDELDLELME
jgi:hypothetical protein